MHVGASVAPSLFRQLVLWMAVLPSRIAALYCLLVAKQHVIKKGGQIPSLLRHSQHDRGDGVEMRRRVVGRFDPHHLGAEARSLSLLGISALVTRRCPSRSRIPFPRSIIIAPGNIEHLRDLDKRVVCWVGQMLQEQARIPIFSHPKLRPVCAPSS